MAIWFLLASLAACYQTPSFQDRYLNFLSTIKQSKNDNQAVRALAVMKAYDSFEMRRHLNGDLEKMTIPEIIVRFRASNDAAAIAKSGSIALRTFVYHNELERRGLRNVGRSRDTYSSLLDARLFNEARDHFNNNDGSSWGELLTLHTSADLSSGDHLLLDVPHQGTDLRLKASSGRNGTYILVVTHPQCQFAARSVADIEANAQLAAIFSHSTWVTSAERLTDLAAYRRWNHDHPDFPISIVYRPTEWREVTAWDSPTFLFIRDGKVVERVVGWPSGGRATELLAAAHRIGLTDSVK